MKKLDYFLKGFVYCLERLKTLYMSVIMACGFILLILLIENEISIYDVLFFYGGFCICYCVFETFLINKRRITDFKGKTGLYLLADVIIKKFLVPIISLAMIYIILQDYFFNGRNKEELFHFMFTSAVALIITFVGLLVCNKADKFIGDIAGEINER